MSSSESISIESRSAACLRPFWYAAYICANHEKRVAEHLAGRGVEYFLPLYEAIHQWKDRRVRLKLPLFPGYVFVRLPLLERLRVLQAPGVARLVGFGDTPEPLADADIEALRKGLQGQIEMEPHPYVCEGQKLRILRGPLAGMEGTLLRRKGGLRLVLSIDLIMRSVVVDVDAEDICPIDGGEQWKVLRGCDAAQIQANV
ncbi:MAG TPA: UpxY family transcription antiterminator [Candidatus Acidoferrales bacterium]|nr:UpxY family transcription antiterminator [Candidatus Acidoferrales bacterium]